MILRQAWRRPCVEQRRLFPEVPVQAFFGRNPNPFRQFACRQTVYRRPLFSRSRAASGSLYSAATLS